MTRLAIALSWFVLGIVAGCTDHSGLVLFREDFETACGDVPCGWTLVAGAPGSATYVETIPSEHGVQLVGDGVAIARSVSAGASDGMGADPIDATLRAHVVARCDPGATVTLIVTLDAGAGHTIDVSGGATYPPTWDGTRTIFELQPVEATDMGALFDAIERVTLHKQGAGACEVDYVSLADRDIPFPE